MVARRRRSKGQQDAIAAVGRLARAGVDVELELVGAADPDFDAELRRIATDSGAGERVRFIDPHPGHLAHLARADMALTCSRSEAFGRSTVEAMKYGKPVIGAAAGGTEELVHREWNGLLYAPGDVAGLARCIERLADDRPAAQAMGERGRAWALRTFNGDIFATELEDAFASVQRPSALAGR
jgi:glycosyltransferase involved in cell wall biosynthesis